METVTVEKQSLFSVKDKRRSETPGFIIKDNGKKIGFEKTKEAAEKVKADYLKNSAPLDGMKFTLESHTQKSRDPKDASKIKHTKGFLLRGDDGKYSKFSTDRDELIHIIKGTSKKEIPEPPKKKKSEK